MKLEELENLNREDWFKALKGTCKSRVDLIFCLGLLLFILVAVAILTSLSDLKLNGFDIIPFVTLIAIGCILGLITLNNYRFRKRADSLNTPDQLLHTYEKTVQNNTKYRFVNTILITCFFIFTIYNGRNSWWWLAIVLIILAVDIFLYFKKELVSERDKEIIRVLKELSEEEQAK